MNIILHIVFLVKCTLNIYPIFYVMGTDILDATTKANNIVRAYNTDAVILSVSSIETALLDTENTEE